MSTMLVRGCGLWTTCCPSFAMERATLRNNVSKLLINMRLPFASKELFSQEDRFCLEATRSVLESLNSERMPNRTLLSRLARNFWKTNEVKSNISCVRALLPRCTCPSNRFHSCGFTDVVTIPEDLQQYFNETFHFGWWEYFESWPLVYLSRILLSQSVRYAFWKLRIFLGVETSREKHVFDVPRKPTPI